jgi:hypothetical protein
MRTAMMAGLIVLCAAPADGQNRPARELATMPLMLNPNGNVVVVSWGTVQKATEYELQRCEGTGLTTCTLKTNPRITSGQPLQVTDNVTVSGTYLYRVTAFGSRGLPIAQNQVAWVYTAPPTAILVQQTGTAMVTPAGPAQVTAVSPVPGQIQLSWSSVPDAYGNLILKVIDAPVDFRWTYSYKVYARLLSGTSEFLSAAGPIASATSLPFVQVSGLTYTIVPSVRSPGNLDLTLRWNAVAGAEKYIVIDKDYNYVQGQIPGTAAPVFTWIIGTRTIYNMCVGVQYPYNIRQPQTEPCVAIKT